MQTERNIWLKVLSMILTLALLISCVPNQVYAMAGEALESLLEQEEANAETIETPNETKRGVYEVTELREANVKHFALEDGTYTAVMYGSAVHTQDAEGNWQDIDNRLADSGSEFSTSNARIKFAKKITGNETLFTLHDGNRKITMSLNNAIKKTTGAVTNHMTEFDSEATQLQKLMTLDNLSSEILYADILDGVDLQYVVESLNVKENIIVKERKDSYQYTFTIALNNLEAEMAEDGSVRIYDPSTREAVYSIPTGFMYDANGEYSTAVVYTLTNSGNSKYSLVLAADATWINAEDRAFPIVIDPSVNISNAYGNFEQTFIETKYPYTTGKDLDYLAAGNYKTAYIKLNTLPELPNNAYIIDAQLLAIKHRFWDNNTSCLSLNLGTYPVISDWGRETLDYYQMSHEEMGQIVDHAYDSQAGANNVLMYTWDITQHVLEWYNNQSYNFGLAITAVDPPANASDEEFRFLLGNNSIPPFSIRYKVVTGIEEYWSYSMQSAGSAGIGYVNNATGALTYLISTIATTDSLFAYMPTLVYDSNYAGKYFTEEHAYVPYDTELVGRGFKISMFETLHLESFTNIMGDTDRFYVWNDSDGTTHYFIRESENDDVTTYRDADGLNLKLDAYQDHYALKDQNGTVRRFRKGSDAEIGLTGGVLESITDRFGNQMKFILGAKGKISEIQVIPNGEDPITMLTLHYNSSGLLNTINNVAAQQVVEMYYSEDGYVGNGSVNGTGYLTEVRHRYENTTIVRCQYAYDATGKLVGVNDTIGGKILLYTYDDNRVTEVRQLSGAAGVAGQKITFDYGDGYTEIQSSGADDAFGTDDDIISAYVFDDYARCICSYSMDKQRTKIYGASTGEYETTEKAKNSIKSVTTLGGVSSNYLFNGGFEQLDSTGREAKGWVRYGNVSYTIASNGQKAHDHNNAQFFVTAGGTGKLYQYVKLQAGDYTLSADFETATANGVNVTLNILKVDSGDMLPENIPVNEVMIATGPMNSDLAFTISESGIYQVYIEVTCDNTVNENGAKVYVDNVMLEKRHGASGYSVVEFGNFEDFSCDIGGNPLFSYSDSWSCTGAYLRNPEIGFGNALYFYQNSRNTIMPSQIVYQATQAAMEGYDSNHDYTGQAKSFTLSGMAKGSYQIASGSFGLQAYIKYMDGTSKTLDAKFYYGSQDWQFTSTSFVTDDTRPIEYIEVRLIYKDNPGVVYFDEIYLTQANSDATITAEYNNDGRLASQKNGEYEVKYYYDSDGNVTGTTNNQGEIISYTYDEKGALKMESYEKMGIVDGQQVPIQWYSTVYTYDYDKYNDSYGLVVGKTHIDSSNMHNGDASTNRFLETTYEYKVTPGSRIFGALISEKDNLENETRYFYNKDNGRLTAVINGETGDGTIYTYDKKGNITSVMPARHISDDIVWSVVDAEKAEYTYSSEGRLIAISTASTMYCFSYDVHGNLSQVSTGNNAIARYTYNDADGKLEQVQFLNGTNITYEYNELEKISAIWYTENGTRKRICFYYYNAAGLLSRYDDYVSNKTTIYQYDADKRLIGFLEYSTDEMENDFSSDITYDTNSRVTNLTYRFRYVNSVGGTNASLVTYLPQYSEDGDLIQYGVTAAGITGSISYTLGAFKRVAGKQFSYTDITTGDSFTNDVSYEYEARKDDEQYTSNRIKAYTSEVAGANTEYSFEYDAYGNIIKITVGNAEYRYSYDTLGQLLREDNPHLNRTYVYEYDAAGNIKEKRTYTLTDEGVTPTIPISTDEYKYVDTNWGDKLTSYRGQTISYDEIGNPLSYYNGRRYTFTWGAGGNLVRAVVGTNELVYKYNDNGLSTTKDIIYVGANNETVTITHKYRYDGNRIITEEWTDENGCAHTLVYLYDADNSPIGMQYRNNQDYIDGEFYTYWFEKNLQGDIVAIYNSAGIKMISYAYDAWGNFATAYYNGCTASSPANYNPFRYRGYYYDSELQMYYLQSRYYDPATGRMLQPADVLSAGNSGSFGSYNMFVYCNNSPSMSKLSTEVNGATIPVFLPAENNNAGNLSGSTGSVLGSTSVPSLFDVIGGALVFDQECDGPIDYWWFISIIPGTGYSKEFNTGKPVNFYLKLPDEWWQVWEVSAGFDINYNGYGFSYSAGPEGSISFHTPDGSFDFYSYSHYRYGIQISTPTSNGIYEYIKIELNTLETVPVVVCACYAIPYILKLLAGAGGTYVPVPGKI